MANGPSSYHVMLSYLFKKQRIWCIDQLDSITPLLWGFGKDSTSSRYQLDVRYWTLGIQKARHKPNDSGHKVVAMSNRPRGIHSTTSINLDGRDHPRLRKTTNNHLGWTQWWWNLTWPGKMPAKLLKKRQFNKDPSRSSWLLSSPASSFPLENNSLEKIAKSPRMNWTQGRPPETRRNLTQKKKHMIFGQWKFWSSRNFLAPENWEKIHHGKWTSTIHSSLHILHRSPLCWYISWLGSPTSYPEMVFWRA